MIGSQGVVNGATVDLTLMVPAPEAQYAVRVALPQTLQALHGSSVEVLSLTSTSTVGELKDALALITGMTQEAQQLVFGSLALLSDEQTLGYVGIASGDTVDMSSVAPTVNVRLPAPLNETLGPSIAVAAVAGDTVS